MAAALEKRGKSVRLFVSDEIAGRIYKKIPAILKRNLDKVDFVLLDATFYKKKWRDLVKKLAGRHRIFTIYVHCKLATCLKRNKKRRPSLPEKVIHIMYRRMEKPRRPDISLDTEKIKPREAVKRILRKMKI